MANKNILAKKQEKIDEIAEKIKNSNSVVFFDYQGLTVEDTNALRRKLKESGSELKIYKNTLVKRALDQDKIDIKTDLEGPKAIAFGTDSVAPIKVLSDFAKKHDALVMKLGLVDGELADQDKLNTLAKIPSRDGLYTMIARGLLEPVKKLSICLDMYAKQKEEN